MGQLVSGALAPAFLRPRGLLAAATRPAPRSRLQALAELLRATPREQVFDRAAEAIGRGATPADLLGAVLLAGAQDVRPWPPGVKFHVVLMVSSAMDLSAAAGSGEAWLPFFFNLHVLKQSQDLDRSEGDWSLPAAPSPLTADIDRARRALASSLEAWDLEMADRAATAAAGLLDLDELFEILWPIGARDFSNIGHLMIHAAQAHRSLRRLPVEDREPVIRSLIHGLLGGRPGKTTASFEYCRRRAPELPEGWEKPGADPEASRDVLARLRTASGAEAVDHCLELLRRGVAADSIRDGLRLAASEMLLRLSGSSLPNAQLLGVHPMTILNAFHHATRTSRSEPTRRLMLLQSAAWIPAARDVLAQTRSLSMMGPGIDALPKPGAGLSLEEAMAEAARDRPRAAAALLGAVSEPGAARLYQEQCRSLTLRKAPEHHHHKYAAALFEEHAATHPRWAPYLLAVAPTYLPARSDPDSEVTTQARAALRGAGLGQPG